jgi:hypothetical protein
MQAVMVKVRNRIVNVQAVTDAKWEGEKLYLHFVGGGFAAFSGKEAEMIWSAVDAMALNLETGEVGQAVPGSVSR